MINYWLEWGWDKALIHPMILTCFEPAPAVIQPTKFGIMLVSSFYGSIFFSKQQRIFLNAKWNLNKVVPLSWRSKKNRRTSVVFPAFTVVQWFDFQMIVASCLSRWWPKPSTSTCTKRAMHLDLRTIKSWAKMRNWKWGYPIAGWFTVENPIKMDDLGVPPFMETSIKWWELIWFSLLMSGWVCLCSQGCANFVHLKSQHWGIIQGCLRLMLASSGIGPFFSESCVFLKVVPWSCSVISLYVCWSFE